MKHKLAIIAFVLLSLSPSAISAPRRFCREGQRCTRDDLYLCLESPGALTASIRPGQDIEVRVMSDVVSGGIQGWSYAVAHDPEKLQILEATIEGLDFPPLFFDTTSIAAWDDPPQGFVSAVVLAIFPRPGVVLPTGDRTVLARARYRARTAIDSCARARIEFTDGLVHPAAAPATGVSFTIGQITHHPEVVFDAELGVMDFPFCSKSSRPVPVCFARGDSDGNTGIDLTDAVVVVQNIFLGKLNRIDCDDALDINDDGLLDTTDPLVLLSWLFLAGEDPPPPFLECGPDSTEDELSCDSFAACEA